MYLFKSKRLGFRNWINSDLEPMTALNQNPNVMEFFPSLQDETQTADFIKIMHEQSEQYGYCYFAVDHLKDQKFIGFIGLAYQTYEAPFTPATDIGWRLSEAYWGQGLATEGAIACLDYGFEKLKLENIYSVASVANKKSIRVMEKIGMKYLENFDHPKLLEHESLRNCVLYLKKKEA